jgi:hypothetical protein
VITWLNPPSAIDGVQRISHKVDQLSVVANWTYTAKVLEA